MNKEAIDVFLEGLKPLPLHTIERLTETWFSAEHNLYTDVVIPYLIELKLNLYEIT